MKKITSFFIFITVLSPAVCGAAELKNSEGKIQPVFRAAPETKIRRTAEAQLKKTSSDGLALRGKGNFYYMGIKLYEAQLYLPADIPPGKELPRGVSKKLSIRYFKEIPRDAILRASEKNLRGNPEVDYEKIRSDFEKLNSKYVSVRPGDVYDLLYSQKKTSLYFNGLKVAEIEGEDFAEAYFGIWFSKYPINQKLKQKLLGVRR